MWPQNCMEEMVWGYTENVWAIFLSKNTKMYIVYEANCNFFFDILYILSAIVKSICIKAYAQMTMKVYTCKCKCAQQI